MTPIKTSIRRRLDIACFQVGITDKHHPDQAVVCLLKCISKKQFPEIGVHVKLGNFILQASWIDLQVGGKVTPQRRAFGTGALLCSCGEGGGVCEEWTVCENECERGAGSWMRRK